MRAPSPYDVLPRVPSFTVASDDVAEGRMLTDAQVYNRFGLSGQNVSPHLRWHGFPPETRSFAVTCFDPDTPSGKGFWHWVLFDLPAGVTELPSGAGSTAPQRLPAGAIHASNGYGENAYGGAAPPKGDPAHRYIFAVHALDVDTLGVDADTAPAAVVEAITAHTLARGVITPVYGH